MSVKLDNRTGIVVGANKNERVILWEDDTFERFSHAEFARTFNK